MSLLPRDSWQEAWASAVALTVVALQQADPAERCARSGAAWNAAEQAIEVDLLARRYRIQLPDYTVVAVDGGEVPQTEKILILHYLQTASGAPVTGEWIGFAQVPGGELYLGPFRARSVDRLVRAFAGREADLLSVGAALGAVPSDLGDVAATLTALPRVPLALVLYRGDDEFPPSGNLLFDASVTRYLPLEDMVVLAGMAVGRLVRPEGNKR